MQQLLKVDEAAAQLALRPCTIRKMIYERRLPVVRIGRAVRIKARDLEAVVTEGYRESVSGND